MSGRATTINDKIDSAITAQESGDYTSAIAYLLSAKMLIAGLPDSGHGDNTLKWRGGEIDAMLFELRKMKAASTGIQYQKVEYTRPGTS